MKSTQIDNYKFRNDCSPEVGMLSEVNTPTKPVTRNVKALTAGIINERSTFWSTMKYKTEPP